MHGLSEGQAWLVRVSFAAFLVIVGVVVAITVDKDAGLGFITLAVGSVLGGAVVYGANEAVKASANGTGNTGGT